MNRSLFFGLLFLLLFCVPGMAWACGSRWELTELGWFRLSHFSLFLGLMAGTPAILSRMSAYYQKDFPKLPKLGYFKSLAIVLVVGLTFQLTVGLFMDTRGLTNTPALRGAEDQNARNLKMEVEKMNAFVDVNSQNFQSILKKLPKSD